MPVKKQLILPNNCKCSGISVMPKNWKSVHASIAKPWTIYYRFYDPVHSQPKQVQIKGMNDCRTLIERQEMTRQYIKQELDMLVRQGYNPFTKTCSTPDTYEIDPDTPVFNALTLALKRLKIDPATYKSIASSLKQMEASAVKLRYLNIPISEIRRKHIKMILSHVQGTRKLSESSYNHYRAYISMLFTELVELEAAEFNPVIGIAKQAEPKKIKKVLSMDERKKINDFFVNNNYPFWRYMHIFYHSGGRTKELFSVRTEDVDLIEQTVTVTIKKGKQFREVKKVIKDIVLPLWTSIMSEAKPGQYLFSRGFVPGAKPLTSDRTTKIWKRDVKEGMGININFYNLKHLHSTEISDLISQEAAAKHNSHTTTGMVKSIYDLNSESRERNQIKSLKNTFI